MLRRAVDRGEVRPGTPALEFVVHMMLGAFVTCSLLDEKPPTRAFLTSYIEAVVLPALGVRTS